MIGQRVAQYRIVEKLGGGAMGSVYLAEDETLGRRAVLKFIDSDRVAGDPRTHGAARARLVREARAASSLDHPNICTIYGVGETEAGHLYIAMPYYEGETLEQRLTKGRIETTEAIDLLTQAALGLGKAHRHGIVHRDVKPRNLIVTPEGRLKVLDFGLAKGLDDDSVTGEILIGTPIYLAPERLMHERLEPTADQWSLAVVAYEMFVGRLPFADDGSAARLLRSISEEDPPPPSEIRADLPKAFDATLARALDKDPEKRFPDVLAFANAVREAFGLSAVVREPNESWPGVERSEVFRRAADGGQESRSRNTFVARLSAVLLATFFLGLGGLGWWSFREGPSEAVGLGLVGTRPLTHEVGLEKNPRFSPDDRWLVYSSDQNGNLDIWIRQIDSGATAPLTADYLGYDDHPIFSPDGRHVVFVSARDGGGIYAVPTAGGEPRRLLPYRLYGGHDSKLRAPTLALSPDGSTLAIGGTRAAPGLFLLSIDAGAWAGDGPLPDPAEAGFESTASGGGSGSEPTLGAAASGALRTLPVGMEGALSLTQPAFSPDGRRLAYVALQGTATTSARLWLVPLEGGEPTALTEGLHYDYQPEFGRDGRRLFFVSDRGGLRDVWWLLLGADGLPTGPPRALSAGIGLGSYALDAANGRMVYAKVEERSNIWRMPILDRPGRIDDARPLTSDDHLIEMSSMSPDGRRLAFDSNRSGNADLWMLDMDDGELRQLTTDPAHDWCPRFSPDGRRLTFYSLRAGTRDIHVLDLDGGDPRLLAPSEGRDWMPYWSPDGKFLVFDSDRSGERNIWRVGVDGGEPNRLTEDDGAPEMYPVLSPDGRRLAFTRHEGEHMRLVVQPIDGGRRTITTREPWHYLFAHAWSAESGAIYAQGQRRTGDPLAIWEIDPESGEARKLSDFRRGSLELMESLAVLDGHLYFPLWEMRGDLWSSELESVADADRDRKGR